MMKLLTVLTTLLAAIFGAEIGPIPKQPPPQRILTQPVDLTWGFDSKTIYWPGSQVFVVTKHMADYKNVNGNDFWYASRDFCAGEHGGTHFDAPFHFYKHGLKVGEIPLEKLIVPGIVVDVNECAEECCCNSDNLRVEHLEKWVEINGNIPDNAVVLVRFGWAQYYGNKNKYLGMDANKTMHFPGITEEAARWLLNSTTISGVGVDTASVDPGDSQDFMAHRLFSENQIYNLENVNIPLDLPSKGFILYVMPMKLSEGSGAPLRVVAVPLPENLSEETTPQTKA